MAAGLRRQLEASSQGVISRDGILGKLNILMQHLNSKSDRPDALETKEDEVERESHEVSL